MNTLDFIYTIFEEVEGDFWLELFYIRPDDHPKGHRLASNFVQLCDYENVQQAVANSAAYNCQGFGVFFGVCPRNRDLYNEKWAARGKETDVSYITAFWTELDSLKNGNAVESDIDTLMKFTYQPSVVVRSGGGVHAYWLLKSPVRITADNRPRIKSALRGLGVMLKGDTAVAEYARILRLPGFVNTKPSRNNAAVEIAHIEPDRRYDLEQMMMFETMETPRTPTPVMPRNNQLPYWIKQVIEQGVPESGGKFGGRNNTFHRAGFVMFERGLSFGDVWGSVGMAAVRSGLSEREAKTLITSAQRRAGK